MTSVMRTCGDGGYVAPGFESVRDEFERNFAERGEVGAAVAAFWRGRKVVDLWGGCRNAATRAPWEEDTKVIVFSTTKGLSAIALAVANARGWLDYDARVSDYWPDFAQNGKQDITVRQLLNHEAGLVCLDDDLSIERMRDLDGVAEVLARQTPAWRPGTKHGYHAITLGLYMQELIRQADPARRTLGQFFGEEIAMPLELDVFIGLPANVSTESLAKIELLSSIGALRALPTAPLPMMLRLIWPWSLMRRSMLAFANADWNDRRCLEVEIPAGNGVGTARAIARAYSALAEGGAELGIGPETMARITAPPGTRQKNDAVLGVPSFFSLGFFRPGPGMLFGSNERAFGAPGAGGSFAFADPDAQLGYAYVMNRMDYYMFDDPREKSLRDAIYRCIAPESGR